MEKVMTVEEKIRRAEEIYERRKQGEMRPVAKVTVNDNKKDVKLLKKMIMQILICIAIYLVIYTIDNNQYVFSEDFINEVNGILSYDMNFKEIYSNIRDFIKGKIVNEEAENAENAIGGAEENKQEDDEKINENVEEEPKENEQESKINMTQEEQDINNIKNTTGFIKPINGIITSKFGQREPTTASVPKNHTGTDIAADTGTKIISATDGEVVLASEEGDYGKHLKIQIGEVSVIYAHCNSLYVNQGDKIKQGQEIAEVGSTGNSTGPHLHFEIRISERIIDPEKILNLE